ncbi:hypothetical protein L1987_89442 [Smallanthus sonchifolius]|nr:hypothetical protein L1987_89442 [Smallanthus sonchifolius]
MMLNPLTGPLDGHLNLQSLRKPGPMAFYLLHLVGTDPLYLSFLSECFSKPSFFQNLLRSSFFLRTQGKEDEPYYCKTQKIEQKKYSLTGRCETKKRRFRYEVYGMKGKRALKEISMETSQWFPAMRLLCCLTRKRERSSGLN